MAFVAYDKVRAVMDERERKLSLQGESEDYFFKQLEEMGINIDRNVFNQREDNLEKDPQDSMDEDIVKVTK